MGVLYVSPVAVLVEPSDYAAVQRHRGSIHLRAGFLKLYCRFEKVLWHFGSLDLELDSGRFLTSIMLLNFSLFACDTKMRLTSCN